MLRFPGIVYAAVHWAGAPPWLAVPTCGRGCETSAPRTNDRITAARQAYPSCSSRSVGIPKAFLRPRVADRLARRGLGENRVSLPVGSHWPRRERASRRRNQGVFTLDAVDSGPRPPWLVWGAAVGCGGSEHAARNADQPRITNRGRARQDRVRGSRPWSPAIPPRG